jgi:hypothetical protein
VACGRSSGGAGTVRREGGKRERNHVGSSKWPEGSLPGGLPGLQPLFSLSPSRELYTRRASETGTEENSG